jgi:riboflavin synthase
MFTGLIEDLGEIRALRKGTDSIRLTVATAIPMEEIRLGDSIAVNGICLTVISSGGGTFTADVSPETVHCTTLSEITPGNCEKLSATITQAVMM